MRAPAFVGDLGASALGAYAEVRALFQLFVRTLYYTFRGRRERGAVVREMYAIGNRSLGFVTMTLGTLGVIITYQAGVQTARVIPDYTMLGGMFLQVLVRDLAASLGALMLATRVGAGIAAELGSMVVTEQIDALRMCAADPVDFLVVPRFLASLVMTMVLVIWGAFVAFWAGAMTAQVAFAVPLNTFVNVHQVTFLDLGVGLVKCVAYGGAIPIVSAHCGLGAFGGSEGVGSATTRGVVYSSLAIIMLNAAISSAALLVFRA